MINYNVLLICQKYCLFLSPQLLCLRPSAPMCRPGWLSFSAGLRVKVMWGLSPSTPIQSIGPMLTTNTSPCCLKTSLVCLR